MNIKLMIGFFSLYIFTVSLILSIYISYYYIDSKISYAEILEDQNNMLYKQNIDLLMQAEYYELIITETLNTNNMTLKDLYFRSYIEEYTRNTTQNINNTPNTKNTYNNIELNPSISEVKQFLYNDDIDQRYFLPDIFDCTQYSNQLVNHALKAGIFACVLELNFINIDNPNDTTAHVLIQFNTSDMGLVAIEPQNDRIAKIILGEEYWDQFIIQYGLIDFIDEIDIINHTKTQDNIIKYIITDYSSCFEDGHLLEYQNKTIKLNKQW